MYDIAKRNNLIYDNLDIGLQKYPFLHGFYSKIYGFHGI